MHLKRVGSSNNILVDHKVPSRSSMTFVHFIRRGAMEGAKAGRAAENKKGGKRNAGKWGINAMANV